MAAVIYLHWTATGYGWIRPGHYHSIIGGDGRVHRLHAYSVDLPAHTYGGNRNSVSFHEVMTHAEAASNRDGRGMYDNYGPTIWGGTGEPWDLLQLENNGPSDSGEHLRPSAR